MDRLSSFEGRYLDDLDAQELLLIAKDTLRELEYYKKLSFDLSTGTAQPSMPNMQGPLYPSKH